MSQANFERFAFFLVILMPGPYFKNQIPVDDVCGCYYPDIILLGNDLERGMRVYDCVMHGRIEIPLKRDDKAVLPLLPLPSNDWRDTKRNSLLLKQE